MMCLKREHKLWQYCLAKKGEGDNHSYFCSEEAINFPEDMYIPDYFSKCFHSIVRNNHHGPTVALLFVFSFFTCGALVPHLE